MISAQEKKMMVRRLQQTTESELPRETLEQMLNEELARPAEELDTELVEAILELLEEEEIPPAQQQEAWKSLSCRVKGKQPAALRWMLRIAAALVLLTGLFFVTWQTAEAFNLRFLQVIFDPLEEFFTVRINRHVVANSSSGVAEHEPGTVLAGTCDAVVLHAPEECPETLRGYPCRLKALPERFRYLEGNFTSTDNVYSIDHLYISDEGLCVFSVLLPKQQDTQSVSINFKTTEPHTVRYICNIPVLFYSNSTEGDLSAFWTVDNVEYNLFGPLTEEELVAVIEATMQQSQSYGGSP